MSRNASNKVRISYDLLFAHPTRKSINKHVGRRSDTDERKKVATRYNIKCGLFILLYLFILSEFHDRDSRRRRRVKHRDRFEIVGTRRKKTIFVFNRITTASSSSVFILFNHAFVKF